MRAFSLPMAVLCIVFFTTGCDTGTTTTQAHDLQLSTQNSALDWRAILDSLPGVETPLPPVALPADIRTHSQVTGESFEARWVMANTKGQSFTAYMQLDRLMLREDGSKTSSWSYNNVARATVATGNGDSAHLDVREKFSRMALGLSASRENEFFVGSTSLSIEQNQSCKRGFQMSHNDNLPSGFRFSAESSRCPQSVSLGTINQWEFAAIPATGLIAGEPLDGFLWLTHRWGTSANVQRAVVLDQLRLVVWDHSEGWQWLSITRSKRRSGRGPKTTLATISNAQGGEQEVAVDWLDNGAITSPVTGFTYPESIRLQVLSMGLDVTLSPVVGLSEIHDSIQTRWSGALEVSGSHAGFAYLDFLPVAVSRDVSAAQANIE